MLRGGGLSLRASMGSTLSYHLCSEVKTIWGTLTARNSKLWPNSTCKRIIRHLIKTVRSSSKWQWTCLCSSNINNKINNKWIRMLISRRNPIRPQKANSQLEHQRTKLPRRIQLKEASSPLDWLSMRSLRSVSRNQNKKKKRSRWRRQSQLPSHFLWMMISRRVSLKTGKKYRNRNRSHRLKRVRVHSSMQIPKLIWTN